VPANPAALAIEPGGRFLYVSHINPSLASGNLVSALYVNATSGISGTVAGSTVAAGQYPGTFLFDRTGQFLYAINMGFTGSASVLVTGPGSISAYAINATSGALTPAPGSPFATGGSYPYDAAIDAGNRYLLSTNSVSRTVAMFTLNAANGALTHAPGSPRIPTVGVSPGSAVFDPSGQFVYLVDASTKSVSAYVVNGTSNTLSFINSVPVGAAPAARPLLVTLQ